MKNKSTIIGKVINECSIVSNGREIKCWKTSAESPLPPKSIDLSGKIGKIVKVSGIFHRDLWEAEIARESFSSKYKEISGRITGPNTISSKNKEIECFRNKREEDWNLPSNFNEHLGRDARIFGEINGSTIYHTQIIGIKMADPKSDLANQEANSLYDLLRIRFENREIIEKIEGFLGSALGYKWVDKKKTDHPAVIFLVSQKPKSDLIPVNQRIPEKLAASNGTWCYTDVLNINQKLDKIEYNPASSEINKEVIKELQSGKIDLIGGVRIFNVEKEFGTLGLAVRKVSSGEVGFLTNRHVSLALNSPLFYPTWGDNYEVGTTVQESNTQKNIPQWYDLDFQIDNAETCCDCAFVKIRDDKKISAGIYHYGADIGEVVNISLDNMDIVGQNVIAIGSESGIQRGTIVAFSYCYKRSDGIDDYSDFLIIGEGGNAFSSPGDSGKILLTDDFRHNLIGIHRRAERTNFQSWNSKGLWSFSVRLDRVFRLLDLSIYS